MTRAYCTAPDCGWHLVGAADDYEALRACGDHMNATGHTATPLPPEWPPVELMD